MTKKQTNKNLRSVFPQYKDIAIVRQEIEASPDMSRVFHSWSPSRQEEFLDFCCGNRGVRILYDPFFKHVFNPDSGKMDLTRLISILIGKEARDIRILPNESYLGADYTLVIMDIVVETSDGSIINVEVQKIGYNFPGERAACYNADLLLRQYHRVRQEVALKASDNEEDQFRKFSYRMIRPVYTIVFMEKSTSDFMVFKEDYVHSFSPVSDTGLHLNLLQNYIFIPLDIFRMNLNEKLRGNNNLTEKEAWFAFLACDDPQIINIILEQYPEIFHPLYAKICDLCRNTAEVMKMYSKELEILDKNTVIMMIEEQQEIIDQQKKVIGQQQNAIEQQQEIIKELQRSLKELQDASGIQGT